MELKSQIPEDIAPAKPEYTALRSLAAQCVARMEAQNVKGKTRDRACIEFFCGAVAGMIARHGEGDETAKHWLMVAALLIQTRGYSEVVKLAKGGEHD